MNGEEVSGEEVQGKRTTKKCGLLGSYERTARNCCRVLTEQVAIGLGSLVLQTHVPSLARV